LILVDSNVVVDVIGADPHWAEWSQRRLDAAAMTDQLVINPVIYAELAPSFQSIVDLDAILTVVGVELVEIPRRALFLAGKAFREYRRRGGVRTGVLPDFFVGAHAAVARMPLITRDPRRYRTYFPTVELIAPEG
jgi:predicted nucleic acid-binding protein